MVQRIPSSGLESAAGNFKNLLINGDFLVWERGTSAATVTASSTLGTYLSDRWQTWEFNDGTITQEQSALDNDDFETTGQRNALLVKCTGTDTSISAAQFAFISQVIEAQNCQGLQWGTDNAKNVTLSFWVKSNLTGTFTAVLRKPDQTFYYIPKEYTINSANTWEKKIITYGPGDTNGDVLKASAGAIDNNNGEGLWVQFSLSLGSNFHGTAGSWGNAVTSLGTSNQTNFMSSTSNNFYLTACQLEIGDTASDFEHLPRDITENRCLRYYYRQKSTDTASNYYPCFGSGMANHATQISCYVANPVRPRTERSIAYSGGTKVYGGLADDATPAYTGFSSINFYDGSLSALIQPNVSGGLTVNRPALILVENDANAYIEYDCEFNSAGTRTASGGS